MITVEKLNVELSGRSVLNDISFEVQQGEAVGIIGPNGAGKTTLLRVLLGLMPATSGRSLLLGKPSSQLGRKRNLLGYLPQRHTYEHRFPVSVRDVVSMGLLPLHTPALLRRFQNPEPQIMEVLEEVGMDKYINRPFSQLSGGEQQRVLLARALVHKPRLLFLDEPVTGLDFPAKKSFMELLNRLKEEKELTVLLISHDLSGIVPYTTSLICINKTMHIHGNPQEVLESSPLQEAYRCQFDFLRGEVSSHD